MYSRLNNIGPSSYTSEKIFMPYNKNDFCAGVDKNTPLSQCIYKYQPVYNNYKYPYTVNCLDDTQHPTKQVGK